MDQQELEAQYVMSTYKRNPIQLVRGEGNRLFDSEGLEYIDFIAGIGSVNAGHGNPTVTQAITEQAGKLLHVSNFFYVDGRGELARDISELLDGGDAEGGDADGSAAQAGSVTPGWKTFFANSGAEAVEGALKLARLYGRRELDGAATIVSARHSFHGRTFGALTATGQAAMQDPFGPLLPGFIYVDINDIGALAAAVDSATEAGKVAAVLLEPIQGEAGIWPCSDEYLQAARTLTAERGQLLVLDEVQTGFFRTGPAFNFHVRDVRPDVVCMAKGLGNGMPIGAFAACGRLADYLQPGDHGSTFGGSPLAIAAARASIAALLEMQAGVNALTVGEYLRELLSGLAGVVEVRGSGLMIGLTLERPLAAELLQYGLQRARTHGLGFIINAPAADILRFLPPLCCSAEDARLLVDMLADGLSELAGS